MSSLGSSSYLAAHPQHGAYPTRPASSSGAETELDSPGASEVLDPVTDGVMVYDGDDTEEDLSLVGPAQVCRNISSSSFFNSVFLDVPDEQRTKPLKVRKKVRERVAPVGPARLRRRSTLSLPRSPRSPTDPHYPSTTRLLSRDNSTASSAHRAITQSFFALESPVSPLDVALLPLPPPRPPRRETMSNVPVAVARDDCSPTFGSDPHFDSAPFGSDVQPGLSPVESASFSPTPSFSPGMDAPLIPSSQSGQRRQKALPADPITPVIPGRAPSKAAKLLGASTAPPLPASSAGTAKQVLAGLLRPIEVSHGLGGKEQHHPPLPETTLTDIQRFFGETPRGLKRDGKSGGRKHTARTPRAGVRHAAATGPAIGGRGRGPQDETKPGEGREYAWLTSDPHTSTRAVRDQRQKASKILGLGAGTGADGRAVKDAASGWGIGMGEIKSVLVRVKGGAETRHELPIPKVYDSFLDLGLALPDHKANTKSTRTDTPFRSSLSEERTRSSLDSDDMPAHARPIATGRSISNPVLIASSAPITAGPSPSALLGARSVSTSHLQPSSPSGSPAAAATSSLPDSSPRVSPPRPRHRPPPLDLRFLPAPRNMPIVIALSPKHQHQRQLSDPCLTPRQPSTRPAGQHAHSRSVDSPLSGSIGSRPIPTDLPGSASSTFGFDHGAPGVLPHQAQRSTQQTVSAPTQTISLNSPVTLVHQPRTPFKHPRRAPLAPAAPAPAPALMPLQAVTAIRASPAVFAPPAPPAPPSSLDFVSYSRPSEPAPRPSIELDRHHSPHGQQHGYGYGYQEDEDVSYFEPITPTAPLTTFKTRAGGAWFKRVVGR